MERAYTLIRSSRKTLALEISRDLQLIVRAPFSAPEDRIRKFVEAHTDWIDLHIQKMRRLPAPEPATVESIRALKEKARAILPEKVRRYSESMGLWPTRVTITAARTRYGSCSSKNALCFSCFLMEREEDLIDYVVVHELAHIKYKNHGKAFHDFLETILPGHRMLEKRLKYR